MPYTTNPRMPKLRARASNLVLLEGWSIRQTAKYFGFNPSTVSKWVKKANPNGMLEIPTESSRPKNHPDQINQKIVRKVCELRLKTKGRCSEVVHKHLQNENVDISLSSVRRILKRNNLIRKRSPWKRYHAPQERPQPVNPGDLVQIDTIHLVDRINLKDRLYIYTLLDVFSRWSFAWASAKMNSLLTVGFVKKAEKVFPASFNCLQSDHGPEFSSIFTDRIKINHRHSRVRKPNDNAHLERFNRTIQNELLNELPLDVKVINRRLPDYLNYYNTERLHMGINFKTPIQLLNECCQGIG